MLFGQRARGNQATGKNVCAGNQPKYCKGKNMKEKVTRFDLLILGSGSTAFAAALRTAELGKTAAMTERRTLGGTCVNRGCLPSKNLIEAARIVWESAHPRYKGLKPAKMDFDFGELISQKQDVVHAYRDKKYQSIVYEEDKIKVFDGQARLLDNHRS